MLRKRCSLSCFFFNDAATTEIYTLSLHDALPISEGKNVITIYFAKPGDVYTPEDPTNPGIPPAIVAVGAKDYEITAIWTALLEFEKVADVVYVETQNRDEADFHYVTYSGTPGPGISLLGSM